MVVDDETNENVILVYIEQLSNTQAAAGQSLHCWKQCSRAGGGCVAVEGERERAGRRT